MIRGIARLSFCVALATSAACTVHQSDAPPLTGPSEFAQSISVAVTPDRITQDGQSQSTVAIKVFGPNSQPISGVSVRLDMYVGGVLADFGTLSVRTVVTGSDGRATAVYTAPPAPRPGLNSGSNTVTIRAIAIGNNAQTSASFTADIRLVPPGVILPPADTPTAAFTVTPTPVNLNVAATFDASKGCPGAADANGNCQPSSSQAIVSYAWDFGDGSTGTGKTASHAFASTGTFSVTLTVTNDRGLPASTTKTVDVGALGGLTAAFVFSPSQPLVNDIVQFNASTSKAAAGHTIVRYDWNFGDGTTKTGMTQTHDFSAAATYNVVLTVTDDTGQQATTSNGVTVGSGAPTATFAPPTVTNPATHTIRVDGSASTAVGGAIIAAYSWSWGDGTPAGSGAVASHSYAAAGSYSVTLTVTDSLGRSGLSTQTATVP